MSSSSSPIQIIQRGHEAYQTTYDAMRSYTEERTADTPDQIWLVEHDPVFTLGLEADPAHILAKHHIPVIETDRGGEVTYHGPGQIVAYLLLDLKRRRADNRLYVREFVYAIEEAVLDTLSAYNLKGIRSPGMPGVYIGDGRWQGAKIAALGVKVKGNGCAYHGVSLNVDMDLTPFSWINPCGYRGLGIVDMKTVGVVASLEEVQQKLAQNLAKRLTT